jgi:exopolysaccharide biosynthesis polyprenyl glycosylphosphotransferase
VRYQLTSATLADAARPEALDTHVVARTKGLRGERIVLLTLDLAVVGVVSAVAGGTWTATATRTAGVVLGFAAAGLYRSRLRYAALDDVPRSLLSVWAVVALASWLPSSVPGTRAFAAGPLVWLAMVAGVATIRAAAYPHIHRYRRGAATVIVGSGEVGVRLAETLTADPGYGLTPIGLVGSPPLREPALPAPLLGAADELDRLIEAYRPERVIVTFPGLPDADLVGTLRRCRRAGIVVYLVPRLFELAVGRSGAELVNGVPLVRMQPEPPRRWQGVAKRAMDVAGAAFGLVVLFPVFAACALAVRWESGRAGVLFRQERIGRDGKPFQILKFRSLTPASEHESQVRWNISHDGRVGPVGRLLRGSSLDELPQLINVLRGDMSLVGPRPERPYFVEQFTRTYAGYPDRHRVLGGITGWAQIHGLRGDTSIEDRVRFDNYYVENWSPALDLKIIMQTVGSMLRIRRR